LTVYDAIDTTVIKQKRGLCDIQYVYACEAQDKAYRYMIWCRFKSRGGISIYL